MNGVTIIIPCFNRECFIKEAIESVLSQEYVGPIEIVVADDGSSDRSIEIANSFGPPVIVLKKPNDCTSQGAGTTRNRAIAASSYPFIAFLDSDDFFLPGHLQRLVQVLESDPALGLVFDEAKTMLNGKIINFPYPDWFMEAPSAAAMLLEPLPQTNAIMVRREVLNTSRISFDSDLLFAEDNDFRLRIAENYPVMFVKGHGSVIRQHAGRSIVADSGDNLFHYDMLMVTKAEKRYQYPKKIVRERKSKLHYHLAVNKFNNKQYANSIVYIFCAVIICPELFFKKLSEKLFNL